MCDSSPSDVPNATDELLQALNDEANKVGLLVNEAASADNDGQEQLLVQVAKHKDSMKAMTKSKMPGGAIAWPTAMVLPDSCKRFSDKLEAMTATCSSFEAAVGMLDGKQHAELKQTLQQTLVTAKQVVEEARAMYAAILSSP